MTTPARIEANRSNAQLSTGPRTDEGKAVSRLNALRHGLRAQEPLLPGEKYEEYEALLVALRAELQPTELTEALLVHRIASRIWRLARVVRMETGILLWLLHSDDPTAGASNEHHRLAQLIATLRNNPGANVDDADRGDHTEPTDVLTHDIVQLGRALARDASEGDALSKLSRYETRLDRGLLRDLRELQRLQESRRSSRSLTPEA